jgi:hypothetical protein
MRLPKLSRLAALASLLGMFGLSIVGLYSHYVELPQAQATIASYQRAISTQNLELMDKATEIVNQDSELSQAKEYNYGLAKALQQTIDKAKEEEKTISSLQTMVTDQRSSVARAFSDLLVEREAKDKALEQAATATKAFTQERKAAKDLMEIVEGTMMKQDDCEVVKPPICMNGHDEKTGKDDRSVCPDGNL